MKSNRTLTAWMSKFYYRTLWQFLDYEKLTRPSFEPYHETLYLSAPALTKDDDPSSGVKKAPSGRSKKDIAAKRKASDMIVEEKTQYYYKMQKGPRGGEQVSGVMRIY